MLDSVEDSFLLIAKINSVPSVVLTLSLDNLNSKGTIIQVPNLYLAWNELHKSLLIKRHVIPSNRIEVSCSPYFDNYSDIVYGKNYALDAEVTTYMDPGKRWIIYLGSSANVCYREDLFLNELLENSRGFLELFNVIIRPHPANSEIWKNWNRPGTLIHPKNSELLDRNPIETMKLMQSSEFCLGINTSAFLDSIACGVPIIALRNSKALFQENSLHFQHLIASGVPIIDSLSELEAAINHNYPNGDTISTIRNKILPNFGNVSESIYANLQDLCFTYKTNRDR
jgi:hypothetical protein